MPPSPHGLRSVEIFGRNKGPCFHIIIWLINKFPRIYMNVNKSTSSSRHFRNATVPSTAIMKSFPNSNILNPSISFSILGKISSNIFRYLSNVVFLTFFRTRLLKVDYLQANRGVRYNLKHMDMYFWYSKNSLKYHYF